MNGELLALGANHKTAPLPLRERLALPEGRAARVLAELVDHEAVHEAVAISTCNRTELYLVSADPVEAENVALGDPVAPGRPAADRAARRDLLAARRATPCEHLFSVTAGLDSMIVGEAEVQGQVKRSYELALVEGVTGPVSNRLFRDALATGKRVRSETAVSRSSVSVSSVAVELARRLPRRPRRPARARDRRRRERRADRARAARPRRGGAVRRQPPLRPRARAWRSASAAARSRSTTCPAELEHADIVVSSTGAPHQIVGREELDVRGRVADGPAARADRPRGAARHRPGRARLPRHRALRHGRPPARGGAQPERAPGGGRGGARDRARGGGALRATGSTSLDVVPTISALRAPRRRDRASRCCARTSPRWESLSEADRERVATDGARGGQPAAPRAHAHPARRGGRGHLVPLRARAARAVRPRGGRCGRSPRRPPRSRASTRAAAPAGGDPARHARQRAGARAGELGRGAACRTRWRSCRSRPQATNPQKGSDPCGEGLPTSRASSRRSRRRCCAATSTWPSTRPRTCRPTFRAACC